MRWYLVGFLALAALAGCGRGFVYYGEREPWRRDAEIACMRSGLVKEGLGVVRITSIDGPGICGMTMPLKVAELGETNALGYVDEPIRPPGVIPGAAQPRWPIAPQPQAQPMAAPRYPAPVAEPLPPPTGARYSAPVPGPSAPPPLASQPMSISPPGIEPPALSPTYDPPSALVLSQPYPPQPNYTPVPSYPPIENDDAAIQTRPGVPPPQTMPAAPPALGPQRAPVAGPATMVEVKPTATLACPIVSALDRWIVNAVQPAARKWFGLQVVEIRQISSYSCRGMNGQPGAHISEHAFGNALDIAAFVLADGHRITVKVGWHGTPEEQGFLRDVQAAACDQFTTVLAPGSNRFHYDHIHVDLMRRASGRRICEPGAVSGDLIAARARQNPRFALQHEPPRLRRYDPPFDARNDPFAWRGDSVRRDVTGSIAAKRSTVPVNPAVEDNDWIEDNSPRPTIDWNVDRHNPQ